MNSDDVARSFQKFLMDYEVFKNENGLTDIIENPYEILAGMTDKLGRIVRQVKHKERDDAKPDWPEGAVESIWGLIAYTIMLKDYYNFDVFKGIENELSSAIEQYGRKDKTVESVVEENDVENSTYADGSVIRIVFLIIYHALKENADKIIFRRVNDDFRAVLMIDEHIIKEEIVPFRLMHSIIARICIIADLKISKKNTDAQDGVIDNMVIAGKEYKLKVKTLPATLKKGDLVTIKIENKGEGDK
jgi:type II secretory ATPase GspE/PulE/Tfp pilus assembly ATPase PilB-like protein